MFSDLEGFTTISERTDPERLLKVLNSIARWSFRSSSRTVTIDKFIGDGVMALYNTPLPQEHHPSLAVLSALQIRDALAEAYPEFEPEFRMPINFGIHTGLAVVGNVGSAEIMDFTAVGDTVNIAARLQGISENGQILISEAIYDQVRDFVQVRPIGQLNVKGRTGAVMTYEVLGEKVRAH
jgi:adenylate cyclase